MPSLNNTQYHSVLEKLATRPFVKSRVMDSKNAKEYFSELLNEGFKDDMLIFETGFVKKYPTFSS